MAQLLLQQNKVTEALKYFEQAAELSRTEGEIVNALSYAEATRTQVEVCIRAVVARPFVGANGIFRCKRSTRNWPASCKEPALADLGQQG